MNSSDYHQHDAGVDTGADKAVFYPDLWCLECEGNAD